MNNPSTTNQTDSDRLAAVLVELDDISEALDRAREQVEKMRRAA